MKKLIFALVCLILLASLAACTTVSPTPQPVPTVTVTATVTSTTTNTATTTATATAITTTTATATVTATPTNSPPPTSTPIINPKPSQFDKYNNGSFFIDKYIAATATAVNSYGVVVSTPVYNDILTDLPLGGFFTDKDANLIAKIPNVTTRDDWYYMFNFPAFDLPFTINLGYKLNNPKAKLDFYVMDRQYFTDNYEKSPFILYTGNLLRGPNISVDGTIYSYKVNNTGNMVALIRTSNAADISGWWIKYGGKHY